MDQFFGLNLAMDITHLQALLSVIFHSLDAYLQKLLNQLGKVHLSSSIYQMGHIGYCFYLAGTCLSTCESTILTNSKGVFDPFCLLFFNPFL